jgi:acetylornithine deacetylase
LIQGGQELSSYPERCVLQIERRTIPGETKELVEAEIQEMISAVREADPTVVASHATTVVREPLAVPENAPIVQSLSQQAASILGAAPQIVGETFWTDAALLAAAGIPAILYGPGGAGAHAVVEWADLEQLQTCTDVLLATALEFCA